MSKFENGIHANCCRLCLSDDKDTLTLVVPDNELLLTEKILAFLSIDIAANDQLSKLVCHACIRRIENWSDFKSSCQRNQATIQDLESELTGEDILQVKEEYIEDHSPLAIDDIEIVPDLTVKSEPVGCEKQEVPSANGEDASAGSFEQEFTYKTECNEKQNGADGNETEADTTVKNERKYSMQSNSEAIQYATDLKLIEECAPPIEMENLSALENSYIEKCKAMVDMYRTLKCACHMATHPNIKGLLSHLRTMKIGFPVFTCYNCMITFKDRSSSGKHIYKCPNNNLDTLVKLSNLNKRSTLKSRIYQNYRCSKCRFIYSFHEDFCKHVNEEHCNEIAPYNCSCQKSFDSLEDYKDHVYFSCMVEYYCDICNSAVGSLKEFINHCQHQHDNSEGFALIQNHNYKQRTSQKCEPKENKNILGKRRCSTYHRALNIDLIDDGDQPSRKNLRTTRNHPTSCLQSEIVYSGHDNIFRHSITHQAVKQETIKSNDPTDSSFYGCPDCQIMYNAADWESHKLTHEKKTCSECGKVFIFQTELEEHHGVHMNSKGYRDPKTHSFVSTMLNRHTSVLCNICNALCENLEDLESHKLTHKDSEVEEVTLEMSKYSCVTCNKHFLTFGKYSDHNAKLHKDMQTTTQAYPRQCDECDKIISSGSAFASHKAMHGRLRDEWNRKSPESDSPLETPKSRKSSNQEMEDYHTCDKCFKVFSDEHDFEQHIKTHGTSMNNSRTSKSPKKFSCHRCHLTFDKSEALNKHIDEEHNDIPDLAEESSNNKPYIFTCDRCVRTFSTKVALIQHKTKQHPQETGPSKRIVTYCKYCQIGFETLVALNEHLAQAHAKISTPSETAIANQNETVQCRLCEKKFISKTALYAHVGWHKRTNNEGSLTPPARKLVPQTKSKTGEFECLTCGQQLPNEVALKIHNIEKHGNMAALITPRCESCKQEFATPIEYENHMKLHEIVEKQEENAAYPCQFCPASFSKAETLEAHKNESHPPMPTIYKCKYCKQRFERQIAFNNHVKVHEMEISVFGIRKPFNCSRCKKGFNLHKNLKKHINSVHHSPY